MADSAVVELPWYAVLAGYYPCEEAMEWVLTQPDMVTAWATCVRPDWMLWLFYQIARNYHATSPIYLKVVATVAEIAEQIIWPLYVKTRGAKTALREALDTLQIIARKESCDLDAYFLQVGQAQDYSYKLQNKYPKFQRAACLAEMLVDTLYSVREPGNFYAIGQLDATKGLTDTPWFPERDKLWAEAADIVRKHFPEPPELRKF